MGHTKKIFKKTKQKKIRKQHYKKTISKLIAEWFLTMRMTKQFFVKMLDRLIITGNVTGVGSLDTMSVSFSFFAKQKFSNIFLFLATNLYLLIFLLHLLRAKAIFETDFNPFFVYLQHVFIIKWYFLTKGSLFRVFQ